MGFEVIISFIRAVISGALAFALLSVSGIAAPQTPAPKPELRQVSFIRDSVLRVDNDVVKLMNGSRWLLAQSSLILTASDVVIVLIDSKRGVLFHDTGEIPVTHRAGASVVERGLYGHVVESLGDGAVLRLNDGSFWEIPSYDRFDTRYWLPPYPVLVTGQGSYLVNLKEVKRVWAKRVR